MPWARLLLRPRHRIRGENYLIATDVEEPSTVQLSVQGVKQRVVLAILRDEAPKAAHYLVLDACRNTARRTRRQRVHAGQAAERCVCVELSDLKCVGHHGAIGV
jgi:hypothetical protein